MLEKLLGNDAVKRDLAAALREGRLSHCVLLCGEEGTGANFAARCLAADYGEKGAKVTGITPANACAFCWARSEG